MPDIWYDVDTALAEVPVNILPLIDDTDFKAIEGAVAYNAAGLALRWHFVTCAGAYTVASVTPTTGGAYDWTDQGDSGIYTIEIPASGGASINNDTEGFGWFTGVATGILPWRGPVIGFRAAALNDALIESAWSTTRGLAGTALPAAAADAAGGLPISDAGGLDMDAVKNNVAAILADTGTDGVVVAAGSKTGYTLTATTGLGNQTANITGNLSGSVGSVTGAVGSVTGAVGSVTGNVGGNVTGSVGSVAAGGIAAASFAAGAINAAAIADGAIDAATFAADVDAEILSYLVDDATRIDASALNTASVTTTPAILADTNELQTDWANGGRLDLILDARASQTSVDTVDGIVDSILEDTGTTIPGTISTLQGNVTSILEDTGTTLDALIKDVPTVAEFEARTIAAADYFVVTDYTVPPTAGAIADQVWDEAIAGHAVAGSTGAALSAAGSAGDPWSTALPGAYAAGSAGYILGTNLDAVLSARTLAAADYFDPAADTVATVTTLTNLPAATADWLTAAAVKADAVTKIQSGLATPTNITAGTITTVTNLTNAPTNGDLTATMKSSVTTAATAATPTAAAVTGAVGSVTAGVTLANGAHGGAAASITLADYGAFKATGFSTHSAADVVTALGDGATLTTCATATGFSTHSAADVVAALGTGSTLTACATATGFSTHSAADVLTALGTGSWITAAQLSATVGWGGSALPTIGTSTLTAQQVWEYATRELTSAGSGGATAQEVWEYATRTLSAGTNLSLLTAQQVWEYATRTLSAFSFTVAASGDWTTDADITQLKSDLATAHGSGSWATATGFELSGAAAAAGASVVSSLASAHGAGSWLTATGFAVPGSAMTLTSAYDAAKTAAQASTALSSVVWTNAKAGYLDAAVSSVSGLDADGVRAAIGMDAADLDAQLDAILTASTPAGGSFTQTVTVNASGGGAIPNAVVEILSGTSPSFVTIDRATTNSSGVAAPTANAGTCTLKVMATGYESYSAALVVTSHAVVPTITLTAISVPSEPDPAKTTAYWYVYGNDSELVGEGEVTMTIEIVELPADRGRAYDDTAISKSTTSGGLISASLFKGAKYKVILSDDREWVVEVPLTAGTTYRMPPIRVVST